jgi:AraC family transcriptional regulator
MACRPDPTQPDHVLKVNRAMDYIREHYGEELKLEKIAQIACLSKYHFHRIFRQVSGETVNGFITRVRLESAVGRLTRDEDVPVTTIALECGFSTSQSFAKAFKRKFQCSPTAIRERMGRQRVRNAVADLKSLSETIERDALGQPALSALSSTLKNVIEQGAGPPINPRIIEMPSFRVAYIRTIGTDLRPIHKAFDDLFSWGMARGLINERSVMMTAFWNTLPPMMLRENRIYDACLTVPDDVELDDEINSKVLPGGTFAVHYCEILISRLEEEWMRFMLEWLPKSKYDRSFAPSYTVVNRKTYIIMDGKKQPAERMAAFDLYLPIKLSK